MVLELCSIFKVEPYQVFSYDDQDYTIDDNELYKVINNCRVEPATDGDLGKLLIYKQDINVSDVNAFLLCKTTKFS